MINPEAPKSKTGLHVKEAVIGTAVGVGIIVALVGTIIGAVEEFQFYRDGLRNGFDKNMSGSKGEIILFAQTKNSTGITSVKS